MSILKLKNQQGQWVSVPTLKGDAGPAGPKGQTGSQGPQGQTGPAGPQRPQGLKGDKGDKGDPGEPGTNMEIHICSITEYDSQTRVPTIVNPDSSTFYLVPSQDGTSPDLFTEWVYVNNAWEMFGSASIDLSGYLTDVTVDGNSVVTDGIANIPIASRLNLGAIKVDSDVIKSGLSMDSTTGFLEVFGAPAFLIKDGENVHAAITPYQQHTSTFYGLAKASGTDEKNSTLPLGQYTDNAKASIQSMLGVPSEDDVVTDVQINGTSIISDGVANIPYAAYSTAGVVKVDSDWGIGMYDPAWSGGDYGNFLYISPASSAQIKAGSTSYKAIVPSTQHESVFYGLAKASGDTTQASSSNSVGTYTNEAKSAIKQMLGVHDTIDSFVEDVTGTDVTITSQPSYRYNCGEVYSLTVTPPSSGTIDFRFTSGSTPTVLTLPQTVKMPEWWVGVEANTIYEMCITDGIYCGVMSWAM